MAPEIFLTRGAPDCYKEPIDVWACGVMLFQLLSGKYPFFDPDDEQMFEDICNDPVSFYHSNFKLVPESAKNLIQLMLEKNPQKRIKANQCLEHAFFTEGLSQE